MDIGIMSMQRIANYGSFLQAYALKKLIEETEPDCKVSFVDFLPGPVLVNRSNPLLDKARKLLNIGVCNCSFENKVRYYRFKKDFFSNYSSLLGIDTTYNISPRLDLLIIGSDEVFNCLQSNANVGFSLELFGKSNNSNRIISFASSFGNTTFAKLRQYEVDNEISSELNNFDSLSVRDNNSLSILNMFGLKADVHLDPVLTYDFKECELFNKPVSERPYLLLYGYACRFTRKECEAIRKFADSKKLEIVCLGGIQSCCDRFVDCSPFEVFSWFKDAEFIITDTFHGSIFSILNRSKFCVFVREDANGNYEKLSDLLTRLDLTGRLADVSSFSNVLNQEPDYSSTFKIIEKYRKSAQVYLNNNIDLAIR